MLIGWHVVDRLLPNALLSILESWFALSTSCVRWHSHVSYVFTLHAGVRQGGVLSPLLFPIFIDDMVAKVTIMRILDVLFFQRVSASFYTLLTLF